MKQVHCAVAAAVAGRGEKRWANASYREATQVSRIPDKMGGARRHAGISCSRTGAVLGWRFHKHRRVQAGDECAQRETAFVSPRTVSNRCNTAERTRQHAGRTTSPAARERWGVKELQHQQTTAEGMKLQIITTRRLEAGSRLHHHPPLLVFLA